MHLYSDFYHSVIVFDTSYLSDVFFALLDAKKL